MPDHPGGVAATNVTTVQAGPDGRASVVLGSSQLIGNLGLDGAFQSTCADSVRNSVFEWFQAPVWQELRGVAYAGQTELRVENTMAGSVVSVVRVSSGAQVGEAVAVHTDVIVPLTSSLLASERLELRQHLPQFTGSVRTPHPPLPPSSGPTTVIETHPAEDLAPRIVEPVFEDTETLVVEGLAPGTRVLIIVYNAGGTRVETVFGTRRMSYESRIGLPAPLGPTGALVRVVLTLGTVNLQTEIVEIRPVEVFRDPVIVPNVFECALVVQVLTVPGAEIVLELDDLFVGQARCTSELAHVAVPVVRLWAGGTLVARQILPGDERTSAPLVVQPMPAGRPLEPRILPPYAAGHEEIWVSSVTPGSIVWVRPRLPLGIDGPYAGWTVAADPIVAVRVVPLAEAPHFAQAMLCDQGPESALVDPQPDPAEPGTFDAVDAPITLTAYSGETVDGQLYEPRDPVTGGLPNPIAGVLVIRHGQSPWYAYSTATPEILTTAHLGYEYLARHLASHGWLTLSIAGDVGTSTTTGQPAPGEHLIGLDALRNHSVYGAVASGAPAVLAGQSNGAEAAIQDRLTDVDGGDQRRIVGIVLLSIGDPDQFAAPLLPGDLQAPVIAITGTFDYGQRVLDLMPVGLRPSFGVMMERAAHHALNSVWHDWMLRHDDVDSEDHLPGALAGDVAQQITRDAVTAFLMGLSDPAWRHWLDGPAHPKSWANAEMYTHARPREGPEARSTAAGYLSGGPLVVDNVGDHDPQLFPLGTPGGPWPSHVDSGSATTVSYSNLALQASFAPGMYSLVLRALRGFLVPARTATDALDFQLRRPILFPSPVDVLTLRDRLRFVVGTASHSGDNDRQSDFLIRVIDDGGNAGSIRAGVIRRVPFERPKPPNDSSFINPPTSVLPAQSWVVPLDALHASNPLLNVSRLATLSFTGWSSPEAELWLDDIEFDS